MPDSASSPKAEKIKMTCKNNGQDAALKKSIEEKWPMAGGLVVEGVPTLSSPWVRLPKLFSNLGLEAPHLKVHSALVVIKLSSTFYVFRGEVLL